MHLCSLQFAGGVVARERVAFEHREEAHSRCLEGIIVVLQSLCSYILKFLQLQVCIIIPSYLGVAMESDYNAKYGLYTSKSNALNHDKLTSEFLLSNLK